MTIPDPSPSTRRTPPRPTLSPPARRQPPRPLVLFTSSRLPRASAPWPMLLLFALLAFSSASFSLKLGSSCIFQIFATLNGELPQVRRELYQVIMLRVGAVLVALAALGNSITSRRVGRPARDAEAAVHLCCADSSPGLGLTFFAFRLSGTFRTFWAVFCWGDAATGYSGGRCTAWARLCGTDTITKETTASTRTPNP